MKDLYKGTTVNERLYLSGLIGKYDKAVQEKDVDTLISILKQVDLDEKNIDAILKFEIQEESKSL